MKKLHDHYFKKAKEDNYPARSVYKLEEMDKKYRLFKPGMKVLDLGASPGSWALYAAQKVTATGKVMALDLNPAGTAFPAHVVYRVEDVFSISDECMEIIRGFGFFHIVMSDMAPKTTGIKFTDQARSFELADKALTLAEELLRPDGNFIVKIFQGPDYQVYTKRLKTLFKEVQTFKPKSSRAESFELFVLGMGFKGQNR